MSEGLTRAPRHPKVPLTAMASSQLVATEAGDSVQLLSCTCMVKLFATSFPVGLENRLLS